ncbi:MAG TPA: SigE family RNA polymerase sigma factor [Intrasporangium sp.]|uniref:SigE family RNA polymerase sigma factor n=1 Tax=Intrasporangium sp. TaxID=1925024 RepID=UPI002B47ED3B|nr:SigE family RNA polymerase sigma factor [Intrasporangium sp.]HKX67492.1 SigE family RNA polymerase sigma factor [Intrasporangium sp.]
MRTRGDSRRDDEFTAFVRGHSDRLHRYGYVLTGSAAEAEELVQETLVKVYLAWERICQEGSPLGYTRAAMARTHVSRWRSWRRRTALEDRVVLDRSSATTSWETEATERDAMWRALATLPPRQRAVVVLRYYEDLTERDSAEALGCAIGTVKSQLSRALSTLRGQGAGAHLLVSEEAR